MLRQNKASNPDSRNQEELDAPVDADGAQTILPCSDTSIELHRLIGQGATGSVYSARHVLLDRPVAVKILHEHLASSNASIQRFLREQAVCGTLSHPGIVKSYAAGINDTGSPFLVMDLLQGETLAAILDEQGPLSTDRFFSIFRQVIEALSYLSQLQLVHRDLKPSNIVIEKGEEERAVIIDFGLARLEAEAEKDRQTITVTRAAAGTSLYMSPEQCTGRPVDCRSDIYALGCVMYEALTGKPLFGGQTTYEVMYKHLNSSLSQLKSARISHSLSAMLRKCLQKEPADRYQTPEDLLEDFNRCSKEPRSRQSREPLVVAGVLLLLLGTFTVFAYCLKANNQSDRPKSWNGQQTLTSPLPPRWSVVGSRTLPGHDDEKNRACLEEVKRYLTRPEPHALAAAYRRACQLSLLLQDYPQADKFASDALEAAQTPQERQDAVALMFTSKLDSGDHSESSVAMLEKKLRDNMSGPYLPYYMSLLKKNQLKTDEALQYALKSRDEYQKQEKWQRADSLPTRMLLAQLFCEKKKFQEAEDTIAPIALLLQEVKASDQLHYLTDLANSLKAQAVYSPKLVEILTDFSKKTDAAGADYEHLLLDYKYACGKQSEVTDRYRQLIGQRKGIERVRAQLQLAQYLLPQKQFNEAQALVLEAVKQPCLGTDQALAALQILHHTYVLTLAPYVVLEKEKALSNLDPSEKYQAALRALLAQTSYLAGD